MRGGVRGKKRRPSSAHSLPPFLLGSKEAPGSPLSGSPQEPPRSCHMLVCAYVCLSVVSRAAWEGGLASIRGAHLGSASSVSSGTPEDRAHSDGGLQGMGCIFPLSLGPPMERAGAVSSLELRVRGITQTIWIHVVLVLGHLGPCDPKVHLLLLRAYGKGGVSALPTP